MSRGLFAALFAAAFTLTMTADAKAVLITSNGDFDLVSDEDGTAPISDIKIISGVGATGRIYTNQTSGAPFSLGAGIRTVSAYLVGGATDGIQHTSVEFADGDKLVLLTVIQGSITSVAGGDVTATFTAGRTFAIKIATGAFDSRNPETFDDGTIVAEFVLKGKEAVVSGDPLGADVTFADFQTNQSSVNSLATQQTQGVFLFREDSQPGQDPGDDLLSNVDQSVIPPGLIFHSESLISDIDQTLLFTDLEAYELGANPGGLGAGDLAVLNAFAAAAGLLDLGGAGTAFATGLGGAATTDFNPQFPPPLGDGPTGDFFATLGADNYVAIQAIVPEPGSMTLLGLGAALCSGFGLRRRRKNVKEVVA
jgi:hypothetical protein